MSRIPKPFELYRHFKGNLYQVLHVAEHSETGEMLVVYQALYGEYKVYARNLDNFIELLDKNKYPGASQEYRFEPVGEENEVKVPCEVVVQAETEVQLEVPAQDATETVEAVEEAQEIAIDPLVLEFLDADTYGEKMNLLVAMKHRITDSMITTMAIACDVEVPEGNLEERYEELKTCLAMREKYECVRTR